MGMKKFISFALAVCISTFVAMPTKAANLKMEEGVINKNISPQYIYISDIGAGLTIESGIAKCAGNVTILQDYDTEITLTLMRSSDGYSWSDLKTWTRVYTGNGTKVLSQNYAVYHGYYYKVHNTTKVKLGGVTIETATRESKIIYN